MIPPIIALAILCSLSTLIIRAVISHLPVPVKNIWAQIFISMIIAFSVWMALITQMRPAVPVSVSETGDILCGTLIFLCAFWCNYWIGNFAGGFRVQMQINLASQKRPVSIKEWMNTFGGLGMDVFLQDRIQSVLIPWKTVRFEDGQLHLLTGWGTLFGRLTKLLRIIMPGVRSE